jgi:hypothetical protein
MAKDIRIFISSPGDVTPERLIAKRVIDRLAREFAHHCLIEPVLWERQPLVATGHFQDDITPPSETDIVVVIIWSRLGWHPPHSPQRRERIMMCELAGTLATWNSDHAAITANSVTAR